jgi:hypothetical protein
MKKEKDFFIVQIVAQNFLLQLQNLIVEQAGLLLRNHCQVLLKQK